MNSTSWKRTSHPYAVAFASGIAIGVTALLVYALRMQTDSVQRNLVVERHEESVHRFLLLNSLFLHNDTGRSAAQFDKNRHLDIKNAWLACLDGWLVHGKEKPYQLDRLRGLDATIIRIDMPGSTEQQTVVAIPDKADDTELYIAVLRLDRTLNGKLRHCLALVYSPHCPNRLFVRDVRPGTEAAEIAALSLESGEFAGRGPPNRLLWTHMYVLSDELQRSSKLTAR